MGKEMIEYLHPVTLFEEDLCKYSHSHLTESPVTSSDITFSWRVSNSEWQSDPVEAGSTKWAFVGLL